MSKSIRIRSKRLVAMVLMIGIVGVVLATTGTSGLSQSASWSESFDGTPNQPRRFEDAYPNWDVQYHVRHHEAWDAPPVTNGHHGPNCEPPLATHQITQWEDTVYQCANHVMTAANGNPGYGLIYLTPDHMADWSDGEAVIRFDISTHRTSQRDWWDVWIAPFDENMARPLEEWYPDLSGPQKTAIQIKAEDSICVKEYRNYHTVSPSNLNGTCQHWKHISDITGPLSDEQRARQRETVEIRISDSLVSVSLNGELLHEYVPQGGSLPFSQGVVQFGHHSYTPNKDSAGDGINTWHWDEVEIEPATPFTIIGTDTRWVDYDNSGEQVVTLDEPAPANAYLRFASTGGGVELSFDGGPFEAATMVNSDEFDSDIQARSYWHPIPEGTETVRVQLISSSWADNTHKMAQDFSVWSRSDNRETNGPAPTNTPVPEPTQEPEPEPTADPTDAPAETAAPEPTEQPTEEPTSEPEPEPTATPTPEPTQQPTATPTPEEEPDNGSSWTMSASVASSTVASGDRQTVRIRVESETADRGLVDVEIYDSEGNKIFQRYWDDRRFGAEKPRNFLIRGRIPADAEPGEYTVKVGIFEPQPAWGTFLAWEDRAATFQVEQGDE